MKYLKYKILGYVQEYNFETEILEKKEILTDVSVQYSETNEEIAKQEAYNGEYAIEDDGVVESTEPSQLDRVEAQVAYTAMMTGTLLEV